MPATSAVSADGHWALSPDQSRVTLTSLAFQMTDGNVVTADVSACKPTYARDTAALSQILDCPFDVPAGTYIGVGGGVLTTFDVLVNDAANGFFTDPGLQLASFTVPGPGGQGIAP